MQMELGYMVLLKTWLYIAHESQIKRKQMVALLSNFGSLSYVLRLIGSAK